MKFITFAAVTVALTAAHATANAGVVLDRIKARGKIVVAYRESSVPFSYLDANRKPIGYALDLCGQVVEAVRKNVSLKALPVEYVSVTSATRIPAMVEGRADLECGSTTSNEERRQSVAFTVPHYITGARYLVRANSSIDTLAGLAGKKVVSTKGSTPLKAIESANRNQQLHMKILEAADHAAGFEMVERGEADGFVMDDVLLYGLIASSKNPAGFKVVGKFLTIEPLSIMLPKGDAAFKRIVDDEMRRLILSGEAGILFDRWFMKPIPPKNTALKLPMNYLLKDFWKYPTDRVPN